MCKIASGLMGDPKKDAIYLIAQAEVYKDHKHSWEIIRGIISLFYGLIPKDVRNEYGLEFQNKNIRVIMIEAARQMHRRNNKKAFEIFEYIFSVIENEKGERIRFGNDSVNEYHHFHNPIECIIFLLAFEPKRKVLQMPEDLGQLYFLYANMLIDLGCYEQAGTALEKAVDVNPVNTLYMFELAKIKKLQEDWKTYLSLTHKCLEFALSGEDLSCAYRFLGYFYLENRDYDLARALFSCSIDYDPYSMTESQLNEMFTETGKKFETLDPKIMKDMFAKAGIQYGPSALVLCTALRGDILTEQDGDMSSAIYFLKTLYDLTGDKNYKERWDQQVAKLLDTPTGCYTNTAKGEQQVQLKKVNTEELKKVKDNANEEMEKPKLETNRAEKLWYELEHQLLYEYRYWPQSEVFDAIKILCATLNRNIEAGTIYYRARIWKERISTEYRISKENDPFKGYDSENSFVNKNPTTIDNGRLNPNFVSYLYMALNKYTALAEVRPPIESLVSIADIQVDEELLIVDLTEVATFGDRVTDFFHKISQTISSVFSRLAANPSDYIITQCISEYIRRLGYDGVMFNSSLHPSGINITVFNYNKCRPVSSELYRVRDLTYEVHRLVPNPRVELLKTETKK